MLFNNTLLLAFTGQNILDRVIDVCQLLSRSSVHTMLMNYQIRLAGHLVGMPQDRIPGNCSTASYQQESTHMVVSESTSKHPQDISESLWYWPSHVGTHSPGPPLLAKPHLQGHSWCWEEAHSWGKKKAPSAKETAPVTATTAAPFVCSICDRHFCARTGHFNHLRTHQN